MLKGGSIMIMTFRILLMTLMATPALALEHECELLRWIQAPRIANGLFTGKMQSSCVISGLGSTDIRKLHDHFESNALNDVVTTHQGPLADNSLGLPGQRWDVTIAAREGQMRNLLRIATDSRDMLAYSIHSKEIHFRGMAGYLRKLNIDYRVQLLDATRVKVSLENLTEVQKPGVAPTGIFLRMAIKNSEAEFLQNLQKLIQEVATNL
jgi:hypothetical protein